MTAQYTVVQYVPDPVAEERINVGVITWNKRCIRSRFLSNWARVRSFGGEDIGFLKDFVKSLSEKASGQMDLPEAGGGENLDVPHLEKIVREWGRSIQFSEPRGSLKDAEALLDDMTPLFLREPVRRRPQPRTRATAAKIAATIMLDVVRKMAPEQAEELVKKNGTVDGEIEPHRFDVVLENGSLLAAVHTISFEINEGEHLEKELVTTKWTLSDVRKKHKDLPMAVFVLPPTANASQGTYRDAKRVFKALDATVMASERSMGTWAKQRARSLDA